MIAKSIEIMRKNAHFYSLYVLAEIVHRSLSDAGIRNFETFGAIAVPLNLLMVLLQSMLALCVFRSALFGISFAELPPNTSRFSGLFELMVKAGILLLISLVPSFILVFCAKYLGVIPNGHKPDAWLTISFGALLWLWSSAVLSYAGTWLPASVAYGDLRFGAATMRGNKTFRKIFPSLTGMILATSCMSLALSFGPKFLNLAPEAGSLSQVLLSCALGCLTGLEEVVYLTFSAVILSHYYLWSEHIEERPTQALAF